MINNECNKSLWKWAFNTLKLDWFKFVRNIGFVCCHFPFDVIEDQIYIEKENFYWNRFVFSLYRRWSCIKYPNHERLLVTRIDKFSSHWQMFKIWNRINLSKSAVESEIFPGIISIGIMRFYSLFHSNFFIWCMQDYSEHRTVNIEWTLFCGQSTVRKANLYNANFTRTESSWCWFWLVESIFVCKQWRLMNAAERYIKFEMLSMLKRKFKFGQKDETKREL